jgi:hypothetical protein
VLELLKMFLGMVTISGTSGTWIESGARRSIGQAMVRLFVESFATHMVLLFDERYLIYPDTVCGPPSVQCLHMPT